MVKIAKALQAVHVSTFNSIQYLWYSYVAMYCKDMGIMFDLCSY